jgi:hypothetical protein
MTTRTRYNRSAKRTNRDDDNDVNEEAYFPDQNDNVDRDDNAYESANEDDQQQQQQQQQQQEEEEGENYTENQEEDEVVENKIVESPLESTRGTRYAHPKNAAIKASERITEILRGAQFQSAGPQFWVSFAALVDHAADGVVNPTFPIGAFVKNRHHGFRHGQARSEAVRAQHRAL